jgi:hypothetical protein
MDIHWDFMGNRIDKYSKLSRRLSHLVVGVALSLPLSCDTPKDPYFSYPIQDFLCYSFSVCTESPRSTRFAILGDSWTDLIGGANLVWTLRTYLEQAYGFKLNGATVAGQRIEGVMELGLHYRVIDQSGPDLHYVILSLGGNDLLYNYPLYTPNLERDRAALFASIKSGLLRLVRSGNMYKKSRWGGGDLVWIIHGYDYLNPDNPLSLPSGFNLLGGCRDDFESYGYPPSMVISEVGRNIDTFNRMLIQATIEEPSLRYVDFRGALGGPPLSHKELLADCIHPNTVGFRILSEILVRNLDYITGHER